jgi:hypothetical protein
VTKTNTSNRINANSRLQWVPISKMKVNPLAQRELNESWVEHLALEFDPDQLGLPVLNERDGNFYVLDGQHRIAAAKQYFSGDTTQQIQCRVYQGLTEADEAEYFLRLNDVKAVAALPKFRAAVHAGRETEADIDRIVRALDLKITKDKVDGGISAVGTLKKVYTRSGPATFSRTLRIIRDAYGTPGFQSPVIDGVGLLCQRYNGDLDDSQAVEALAKMHGGVNGLLGKAENIRRLTGNQKSHCVAAAAVETINRGRGGKKLPGWWKS